MKIKEVQALPIEITTDITCDICGNSCKVNEGIVDNEVRIDHGQKYRGFEFMELKANWGYFSEKDMERWTAHICEKCVDEKLTPLIKFQVNDLHFTSTIGGAEDYRTDTYDR